MTEIDLDEFKLLVRVYYVASKSASSTCIDAKHVVLPLYPLLILLTSNFLELTVAWSWRTYICIMHANFSLVSSTRRLTNNISCLADKLANHRYQSDIGGLQILVAPVVLRLSRFSLSFNFLMPSRPSRCLIGNSTFLPCSFSIVHHHGRNRCSKSTVSHPLPIQVGFCRPQNFLRVSPT